jgi:UV DNA damage endonuclease
VLHAPLWTRHSDFIHPFEFIDFVHAAQGLRTFDVMLEAKAKDLALLRLRADLARFAPDLAGGLS